MGRAHCGALELMQEESGPDWAYGESQKVLKKQPNKQNPQNQKFVFVLFLQCWKCKPGTQAC